MKRITTPRLAVTAAAAAIIAGVTGCGDSDTTDDQPTNGQAAPAAQIEVQGKPDVVARRAAAALARAKSESSKACATIERLNRDSASGLVCPAPAELRKSMGTFKVAGSATYGSGAIVDYVSEGAPDGASIVMLASPAARWGVGRFGLLKGATVDTSDKARRQDFDTAASGYLEGVRERRCALYDRSTANASTNHKSVCANEFPATIELANLLRENPTARPRYLGGNASFGFYGLLLDKPKRSYRTIAVIDTPGAPMPTQVFLEAAGPVPGAEADDANAK